MSKPIYEIKEELRQLLEVIEEAEGEIDDEVGEQLAITEEELGDKIMSYYGVVKATEASNQLLKDEKARLSNLQTTNDRKIEILKSKILDAVNEFGYVGKTGNKKIDLDTLKLYTISKDKVYIENESDFTDARFCHVPLNIPSDMEFVKKMYAHAVSIHPDKKLIQELNPDWKVVISRTKLKEALSLRKTVMGASLEVNTFVVMR